MVRTKSTLRNTGHFLSKPESVGVGASSPLLNISPRIFPALFSAGKMGSDAKLRFDLHRVQLSGKQKAHTSEAKNITHIMKNAGNVIDATRCNTLQHENCQEFI